jgi:hypothetical protein
MQIVAVSGRSNYNVKSVAVNLFSVTLLYNRPYSKVRKSTRVKVAVIFAHIRFSVIPFCVTAAIRK